MNKVLMFEKEFSYIKDPKLIIDAKYLVDGLPDYFFSVAAASTGKYHPKYAQGEGGLVRHTKVAVRIAYELFQNPLIGDKYTDRDKDLAIISLIIHDGLKLGKEQSKYTKTEHPLLSAEYVKECTNDLSMEEEDIEKIVKMVSSHMGIWNKDYNGNEVLPIPHGKLENFVHMCDYLASKKFIQVEFDEEMNIVD